MPVAGFAAVGLVALTVGLWTLTILAIRRGDERLARQAAIGALAFQVLHLAEHLIQAAYWVLHPQRAPYMTPWAHAVSRSLGVVRGGPAAWNTTEMQRGMELLHLVGNSAFLAGAVAMLWLARRRHAGLGAARTTVVVQGLHVAEHVVLTLSYFTAGRALGLSTRLGGLTGTELSSHRVLWHFGVNLVVTVAGVLAARAVLRPPVPAGDPGAAPPTPADPPPGRSHRRPVVAGAIVALVVLGAPQVAASAVGRPAAPAAAAGHEGHGGPHTTAAGGTDTVRDGDAATERVRLVDVAAEVGLVFRHSAFAWDESMDPVAMMGGGLCWIDYDRDGWLDLFVVDNWADGEWGLWNDSDAVPRSALFRNEAGVFTDVTESTGAGLEVRGNGCVAADLDGDGWDDLYVTTSRANALLWNDGGTGFTEGADAAGLDAYGWHTGVAAGDLDGDGRLDLYVAGYADLNNRIDDADQGFPNTFRPVRDLVFRNLGPGPEGRAVFAEVGGDLGVEAETVEYGLGVVLVDVDDDGDLDVYVANDTNPNRLYRNEQHEGGAAADPRGIGFRFVESAEAAGVADPNSGMGVAAGDIDLDGAVDLFVTNLAGQGHAVFTSAPGSDALRWDDGTARFGVPDLGLRFTGWGASWADIDLDTDLDLLVANGAIPIDDLAADGEPLELFCNLAEQGRPGTFAPLDAGLGALPNRNGRAVAMADFDNDGDLDAAVSAIGADLALLRNEGAGGHWLTVDLGGTVPGARVTVELPDGTVLVRHVGAGGSWLSGEDPRAHFGLGGATSVPSVTVTWPDGRTETRRDVPVDLILRW